MALHDASRFSRTNKYFVLKNPLAIGEIVMSVDSP
jgi:hypothetical protein